MMNSRDNESQYRIGLYIMALKEQEQSMDVLHIRSQIEGLDGLPAIPLVVSKLLRVIDSPALSINEIGDIISKDQALTARLLKMVNSPIYGFPGRISSVSQALILLGLNVVKGMLLGISVFDIMEKTIMGLQEHSLCVAVAAKVIAVNKGLKEPEEVMVSALIHDIGKVALKIKFPAEYESAMELAGKENISLKDAEERVFGINHADAGGWLAQKWHFPCTLLQPIAYHHKPHLAKDAPLQTAIVHVADLLVKKMGVGFSGDNITPLPSPDIGEGLSLSEKDIRDVQTAVEYKSQEGKDTIVI